MNKYILLAAVCIISQGLGARVELNVILHDHMQTVLLEENEQKSCTFDNTCFEISNVEETDDLIVVKVAINKGGILYENEAIVDFENSNLVNLDTGEEVYCLEVSASKK